MDLGRISPKRLALLSIVGSLIFPGVELVAVLHPMPVILGGSFASLTPQIEYRTVLRLVALLGYGVLWAGPGLCLWKGVKRGVWTENELAKARMWIQNPLWIVVIAACFLGSFLAVIHHPSGSGFVLMFPVQAILQLKHILKLKAVEQSSLLGL